MGTSEQMGMSEEAAKERSLGVGSEHVVASAAIRRRYSQQRLYPALDNTRHHKMTGGKIIHDKPKLAAKLRFQAT